MLDQNDAAPMLSLTVVLAKQAVSSSRTWCPFLQPGTRQYDERRSRPEPEGATGRAS